VGAPFNVLPPGATDLVAPLSDVVTFKFRSLILTSLKYKVVCFIHLILLPTTMKIVYASIM